MLYDLIIIGGGPAGITAGIYAARKKINGLVLTKDFWGQIAKTSEVGNWPGEISISGMALAGKLEKHLRNFPLEIKSGQKVVAVEVARQLPEGSCRATSGSIFEVRVEGGEIFQAKSLIIATGREPKALGVEGEKELLGKGVSYCPICDAPFFKDKAVAVAGGGNAGLEAGLDLVPYASSIFIVESGSRLRADEILQDKVKAESKIKIIFNKKINKIEGSARVEALELEDVISAEKIKLPVAGIFVHVGAKATTGFLGNLVELNERGEIKIDPYTGQTSCLGVFAAGDATDIKWKQVVIATGQGATAALGAYEYLQKES